MEQLDRLKVFLESLSTPELQRRIVWSEQKVDDYNAMIAELERRIAQEEEALPLTRDIVDERL